MGSQYVSIQFYAEVYREDDLYVALCRQLDVSSFGPTVEEAKASLREAVEAFLEGCQHLGTVEEVLEETGFHRQGDKWVPRTPVAAEVLVATA